MERQIFLRTCKQASACSVLLLAAFSFVSCGSKTPVPPPPPVPAPAVVKPPTPPASPVAAPAVADPDARARPVLDVLSMLNKHAQTANASQKIGFELPESAINDYLSYSLRTRPRPGLNAVHVGLLPANQISLEVEVDFDVVRTWDTGIPDMVRSLLKGKQTLRMNLEFTVENAQVTIKWKDAQGPGAAALNAALAGLLRAVGQHQPEAYDPTKPIPLPYGLKRIWTEKQILAGET